jgi:hypothetical protein
VPLTYRLEVFDDKGRGCPSAGPLQEALYRLGTIRPLRIGRRRGLHDRYLPFILALRIPEYL